ncbi:hypothetical protein HMI54_013872 [Coelomomyces lativittatus]|nr:hypothetical protein HMI56_005949 [Coelomomyces lativittatus]KAJ1497149.1 hypothetical protein HMI54_013872 [Coelomomyces lativittatus]KAJ1505641.1 hypothetical protein HMI55_001514 [Coelomomyces lativittatus]
MNIIIKGKKWGGLLPWTPTKLHSQCIQYPNTSSVFIPLHSRNYTSNLHSTASSQRDENQLTSPPLPTVSLAMALNEGLHVLGLKKDETQSLESISLTDLQVKAKVMNRRK